MSRVPKIESIEDMRPEYNFAKGVRGKYVTSYRRGTNVVLLDPDVAKAFPTSDAVNKALRSLLGEPPGKPSRRGGPTR